MVDIAQHVRIFEANPTDDFVTKRKTAVGNIAKSLIKSNYINTLLGAANTVVTAAKFGEVSGDVATEAVAILKKVAPSFVADRNSNELATCVLLGAATALENARSSAGQLSAADYLALGIWSGLSFQQPIADFRRESLRQYLLNAAQQFVSSSADASRLRSKISIPEDVKDDGSNANAVSKALRSAIEKLNVNAVIDREEIDFLWWSISGWSSLLGAKYANSDPVSAAIATGLEAAQRLRRMPMDAHKELVLRRIANGEEKLTLSNVLKNMGDNRARLAQTVAGRSSLAENPDVFPFLTALVSNNAKGAPKASQTVADWALRALLESTALVVFDKSEV